MTASTMFNMGFRPSYGRQNGQRGGKGWTPKTTINSSHYLQVDMGEVRYVCALATQGSGRYIDWTTSYKIHLSTDGVIWKTYMENNFDKVSKF